MDIISIFLAIRRHWLVAIPIILLTAAAAFYVVAIKAPVYEASESILLLSPPNPPTASQIARNPKLAKISPNNPYADLGVTVAADAVLSVLTGAPAAQALAQAGADPRYQVTLSTDFGAPPIIEITGIGASSQEAIRTANLVGEAAKADLYQIQKKQGVNNLYMIKATELVRPRQAQLSVSGKLRTLIAALALGAILLFVAVSVTDVMQKRRAGHSVDADSPARSPEDGPSAPRLRKDAEFTDYAGHSAAAVGERPRYGAQSAGRSRRTLGSRDT